MKSNAGTPEDYLASLPEDRREGMQKLRKRISENIPSGFEEVMDYGMLGYSVPHSIYPSGYHCDSSKPVPFISLASQKNFIAVYHMGIYADKELLDWFVAEYPKHCKRKLDMGKSCIRFKKLEDIPYDLIGELASKMTVEQWIALYESQLKR